jgi:DNA polymerase
MMESQSIPSVFADPALPLDALMQWYLDAGVDETIGEAPLDRYALSAQAQVEARQQRQQTPAAAQGAARPAAASDGLIRPPAAGLAGVPQQARETAAHVASQATSLEALRSALEQFDGCPLKVTATKTVFADGNPQAPLMLIGEAPGRDEDREGRPFVGESGRLLDQMLASIGLDRSGYYITNVLPWRPPGNRTPTDQEVAVCLPFLRRHIELVQPRLILLLGGLPTRTLFARPEGIMRQRGVWRSYESAGLSHPIATLATLHPAFLLRQPVQKRLAWRDLLSLQDKLRALPPLPNA